MENDLPERKSVEGLTALLGAYASEEEEDTPETKIEIAKVIQLADEILPEAKVREIVQATDTTMVESLIISQPVLTNSAPETDALMQDSFNAAPEQSVTEAMESEITEMKGDFWLPPEIAEEPPGDCKPELQANVIELLRKQDLSGKKIAAELKKLRGYKNPNFLEHCVKYDGVIEYGTCYPKEIFDPSELPKEDFYDRLAAEWNEYQEKVRSDRVQKNTVEFQNKGVQKTKQTAGLSHATKTSHRGSSTGRSSKWDSKK